MSCQGSNIRVIIKNDPFDRGLSLEGIGIVSSLESQPVARKNVPKD